MSVTSASIAGEFKPKMTHDEFITQLREAGFTEKTLAALDEEDINSDAALKILSVSGWIDDVLTQSCRSLFSGVFGLGYLNYCEDVSYCVSVNYL